MAQPPQNFQYSIATHILSWNSSGLNCEYSISYCKSGESNWYSLYTGSEIQTVFNVPLGAYKVRGKAKGPGEPNWGPEGTPEDINVA